jgi:hypothetical protein
MKESLSQNKKNAWHETHFNPQGAKQLTLWNSFVDTLDCKYPKNVMKQKNRQFLIVS